MIPKTAFQQLDDKQIKESAKVAQRVGNSRASSPVTRDGALRGKQCRAIVGDWQRRKNIGDAFCQNEPLENGYCRLHQSLVVAKKSRTRGQQQIIARYQKIGEEKKISAVRALQILIWESAGNVEYLRSEVRAMEKLVISGRKTREEISGLMLLYNEERDRHQKYVMDAVRVRLEERNQEIRASQAEVLASVTRAIIDAIGLMGEQRVKAMEVASKVLLEAGARDESGQPWHGPLVEASASVREVG